MPASFEKNAAASCAGHAQPYVYSTQDAGSTIGSGSSLPTPVQMASQSAAADTAGGQPGRLPRLAVAQMTSVGDTEANYATCAALAKVQAGCC